MESTQPVPSFLIVEDDDMVKRALGRVLSGSAPVITASNLEAARRHLQKPIPWLGWIVDVRLPDGSGLKFLEEVRPLMASPTLVITGSEDRKSANRAAALGAYFVYKPFGPEVLNRFLHTCLDSANPLLRRTRPLFGPILADALDRARKRAIDEMSGQAKLTPREEEILGNYVLGESRRDIIQALEISPKTFDNHVNRILKKTGAPNMPMLAIRVLLRVLHLEHGPNADTTLTSPA